MPNWLNRNTKRYLKSASFDDLTDDPANYILEPDMSAVEGQPSKYWVITGDVVSLADQATRDAIDAQLLSDNRDRTADEFDDLEGIVRSFALVVLDEINVLRQQFNATTAESNQLWGRKCQYFLTVV
jgi:hypothetical protein